MKKYGSLIPFVRWISRKYYKEKSDYGILARWITDHDRFSYVDTKEVFIKRMRKLGCSDFLIETFSKIWENEFLLVVNARVSIGTVNGRGRAYRSRLG